MKTFFVTVTYLLFSFLVSVSFAGGDKNQTKNPIFGDNCIETIPPGIDASACEESPAPGQSGVKVYFCDTTVVVVCTDENEGEEETP